MNKKTMNISMTIGKKKFEMQWPITALADITGLSSTQKKQLKTLVNKEVKILKTHFNDGAWDIDFDSTFDDIVVDAFGGNLREYVLGELVTRLNVAYGTSQNKKAALFNKDRVLYNKKEKVFYSPTSNKVYSDTQMRNVDNDVQLGDL